MSHFAWSRVLLILTVALVGASGGTAAAQTPSITVQFLARGMQLPVNGHESSVAGHIFMVVSVPTLHGPKEEAYGFYPKNEMGIIKGPGIPRSEFRCGPTDDCNPANYSKLLRFSEVRDSVRIPISEEQRKGIISKVGAWNDHQYQYLTSNCINFVSDAVKYLGYPPPSQVLNPTPMGYLAALKENVAKEDQRREIERREAAERRAIEARREAERKSEFFMRVWNIDDRMTVDLNGRQVLSVQDGRDSGRIKLPTQPGDNRLVLHLLNLVDKSGVSFSYMIWKDDQVIAQDGCGTYHVAACNNAIYGIGQVWERAFDLK